MTEDQGNKTWYQRFGSWLATTFRKATVPGLSGALFIGSFLVTVFAVWQYPESTFGKFSQSLGITLTSVLVGIWGADYYHRKDAYKKRFRDVEVSVYTTWLLIAGVEAIRQHIANAKTSLSSVTPTSDDQHNKKLMAHSEIVAGHTAAKLTISMSYMALANLETFSKDAVESGKKKFATNEQEAGTRQQLKEVAAQRQ